MLSDNLLIKEIKNKNSRVFESLFHGYYQGLVKFANQFVLDINAAEDIVQGVYTYLWENSEKIKFKKSVQAYLYQATKNSCLNHLRSLKIRDKHQLLYLEAILKTEEHRVLSDMEMVDDIKKVLHKLPQQMYKVFCKKYFQELSVKEIAKEMSLSENTIKVHLHKGRHIIRKILGCIAMVRI